MYKKTLMIGLFIVITVFSFTHKVDAMTKTQKFFDDLSVDTMHLVDEYYTEDIQFLDPMVEITGRDNLKDYYAGVYAAADEVSFEYLSEIQYQQELVLVWRMTFNNKKLNKGKDIIVDGTSHIKLNDQGQAYYHRDYFDMGAMIYKYVPVMKHMVKYVNRRLAQSHANH